MKTTNQQYYEGTILENEVPWVELGRPVDDDKAFGAWSEALENAISQQLCEMSMGAQGELFLVTEDLRAEAAASGHPIPDEAIHMMRWTSDGDGDGWTTIHCLTAAEYDELHQRCLSLLLDSLTSGAPAAEEAETIRLLKKEWQSRNDAYRNAAS